VVTIADSSTTGGNATRVAGSSYATTTTIQGNRILSFPGANAIYRSSMVLTGAAYTIFTISSLLSTSGEAFGFQRIVNTSGSGGWIFIGTNYGNLATFSGTGGAWNDISPNSPTYTLLGGGLQLVSMVVSGSSLIPYINGTSMDAKTGTTGAITTLDIGGWQENNTQHWNGYIGDIIVYNSALTTSQRQQVEGYLAHKWGLTGYYNPTTPLAIPGCQLWLDGADPAGTGVRPANGTNLTTWKDKSIYNFPITSAGSSYNTTAVNGLPGINISTNPFGYNPGSAQNNWQEVFAVGLWTGGSTFNTFNGFITSCGENDGGAGGGIIFIGDGTTNWYNINAYQTPFLNGIQTNTALPTIQSPFYIRTHSTSAVNVTGLQLGVDRGNVRNWVGFISEVIIYNTALTTTQRQTIENYLAKKWGIGASTIPSTHPYSKLPPA
jgi:hypothetical protein